jgi:hypothetical protein
MLPQAHNSALSPFYTLLQHFSILTLRVLNLNTTVVFSLFTSQAAAMRRNAPQGNRGQDGGPGAPAPAPATTPNTPRKDGSGLNKLILSLENEFRLGLDVHDGLLSPSQRSGAITGKVCAQIQRLYWSDEPALEKALESFREIATGFKHEKQLEVLHGTLKSQTRSPMSKAGTPLSSRARPGSVRLKPLIPCEYFGAMFGLTCCWSVTFKVSRHGRFVIHAPTKMDALVLLSH